MKPVILKNWFVTADPYAAPELGRVYLVGDVYGYPGRPDGDKVTTSKIVASKGRLVTCKSRQYLLDGPPEPGYVKAMAERGITIDLENPIKVKEI